jgi:hypothetical protein
MIGWRTSCFSGDMEDQKPSLHDLLRQTMDEDEAPLERDRFVHEDEDGYSG